MAGHIHCPHCRRLLEIPAGQIGREVRCPHCLTSFVAGPATEITATLPRFPGETPTGDPTAIQLGLPAPPLPPTPLDDEDLAERVALPTGFRPGGALATSLKVLLGVVLVLEALALASNMMQYRLMGRIIADQDVNVVEMQRNDDRQQTIGVAHVIAVFVAGIVFLVWFYRMHANLEPLGAEGLVYTPRWAIWYWFIPILCLFRPVQVAQEIWRNSDPERPTGENSALIGFWWLMYIIAIFSGQFARAMNRGLDMPQNVQDATAAHILANLAALAATLLDIAVVWAIDARQTARAAALHDLHRSDDTLPRFDDMPEFDDHAADGRPRDM